MGKIVTTIVVILTLAFTALAAITFNEQMSARSNLASLQEDLKGYQGDLEKAKKDKKADWASVSLIQTNIERTEKSIQQEKVNLSNVEGPAGTIALFLAVLGWIFTVLRIRSHLAGSKEEDSGGEQSSDSEKSAGDEEK